MADERPRVSIGSLIESGAIVGHKDGNYGSQYPRVEEFGDVGVPFLTAKSISNGTVDIDGAPRLADDKADRLRFGFVRPDDVLLSHNATIGRVAIVPKFNGRLLIGTSLTYFRLDQSRIFPRYLAAFFAGIDFQRQLAALMSHTTRNQVPITAQRHLEIVLPPLREQRAIACILGTLDDKIELNRRMNRTLEAMARAIFQSWFVDFDPVHQNIARAASARRRVSPTKTRSNPRTGVHGSPDLHQGYPPDIAALFPDAFENSELGEIPKGWKVRPIGDVVQVLGGGTPSTTKAAYWEGGIHPFCTPKDMSLLTDPALLETERHLTDEGVAKVSSGQLPVGTVLLSSRAPIGYLAVAETPVSINQGIIAMVCEGELPNLYVLHWTRANMERVIANANGSTFLEISKRNFRPITAVIPPQDILRQFTQIVDPLHQRVVSSLRQSQQLAALRDGLLPKLISGELRSPDALRIVEGVAR